MTVLTALPPVDRLYAGLARRDPTLDGRIWVGVTSTGIFCRPTCPSRTPKPENCRWFASPAEALAAGFRPCKRCFPMGRTPSSGQVQDDRPRSRRGGTEPGFASESALRDALAAGLPDGRGSPPLHADWIGTPLGAMVAVGDATTLHLVEFADLEGLTGELRRLATLTGAAIIPGRSAATDALRGELDAYFDARSGNFTVPLALHGTVFERAVWQALRAIPCGQTASYGEIAGRLGRPRAARAVAGANARNQLAILIPCHRVIGADGSLTGYAGGLYRKRALLALEQRIMAGQSGAG